MNLSWHFKGGGDGYTWGLLLGHRQQIVHLSASLSRVSGQVTVGLFKDIPKGLDCTLQRNPCFSILLNHSTSSLGHTFPVVFRE